MAFALLVSCSRGGEYSVYEQPSSVSFVGILQLMPEDSEFSDFNASHLFQKNTGEHMPVRSLAINLSADRYLGNLLNITGLLDEKDDVFEIKGITVLEVLSPIVEDLTDFDPGFSKTVEEFEDFVDEDVEKELFPSIDMELTYFESLPYSFRGVYPSQWYYASYRLSADGVLHHYGFSMEPVTQENEILSLDVIEEAFMKDGNEVYIDGKKFTINVSGSTYSVYTSVGGRHYRVSGPVEYSDLILNMSGGIEVFTPENE